MGLTSTKTSLAKSEYTLTLSSTNHFYRGLSLIQGEFHFHTRTKCRIEKEIRIDLIGQLVDHRRASFRSSKASGQSARKKIFFTYSSPLVTSHQNGTARTIKKQHITYPFRIPLGINLPPSCQFKEFSINYHLNVYHDGRLLPNIHKNVLLAPPTPHVTIPIPCKVTGNFNSYATDERVLIYGETDLNCTSLARCLVGINARASHLRQSSREDHSCALNVTEVQLTRHSQLCL